MSEFTYILAPNTANNYAVLQLAVHRYADLVQERRIKSVYMKSDADIIDADGSLLAPANPTGFIYVKATTAEIDAALIEQVEGARVYTAETQPFSQYWIT